MAIFQVQARWSGFSGAPGYSNFYFGNHTAGESVASANRAVFDFFQGMTGLLPDGVTVTLTNEFPIFDEVTGELLDYEEPLETGGYIPGTGTGSYSAPSGAVVNWNTATVARGRRLRGRTFLVPLANTVYQSDGTLSNAALNTLNSAASELSGAGFSLNYGIWSRPRAGAGGSFGAVTGHTIPDMAAVLRSRRD